ncbi:rhodanese-related sulfurtransferase [Paenibacillus sp. P96]|uniref:tRNA uridine(34) hydroxylase n=1 Tax=Paenibacillus zeirhizosphaerae TaxID=2987519 RepID=A0ABT9FU37_9BACL|nr:rhodanese-related sulfurtransferase [Paenibacillus sp. P96]MDP4098221.1 rhodanese-related sulfurtransferase [Paenibacillus sp. P96]
MENSNSYRILLYYKYVTIPEHETFAKEHLEYCTQLGIKGRILVAEEGINGTLSGTIEQTEAYMHYMQQHPLFSDMIFKIDEAGQHAFKKLFVRPKQELVTLKYDTPLDPNVTSGKRLSPQEFYEQLQNEDIIVLDGRNNYEYDLGHFRNAIRPDVESFREFPEWIRTHLQDAKDKPILTYCTGGIRCEKLTGVLINEGFTNVAQLDGGIVTYGKDPEVQGRLFDGKMYVFDERISVRVNQTDEDITIGKCHHCGSPTDRYINCADDTCHAQHLCCDDCLEAHGGYCSEDCRINDTKSQAL